MFLATWDDTGNVGIVNMMKAEIKEFTTSTGSDRLINTVLIGIVHASDCQKSDEKY